MEHGASFLQIYEHRNYWKYRSADCQNKSDGLLHWHWRGIIFGEDKSMKVYRCGFFLPLSNLYNNIVASPIMYSDWNIDLYIYRKSNPIPPLLRAQPKLLLMEKQGLYNVYKTM